MPGTENRANYSELVKSLIDLGGDRHHFIKPAQSLTIFQIFVLISTDKSSPYLSLSRFLFATQTITENHTQSKFRVGEESTNAYIYRTLSHLMLREHC